MKIEKVPSPECKQCGSNCIIITDQGIECDDCNRVTARVSKSVLDDKTLKKETTFNLMEIEI